MKALFLGALFLFAAGRAACAELTIATWNLEWLREAPLSATDYHRCRGMAREAHEQLDDRDPMRWICRNEEDYARMRVIAERIDADVFAVQEVEGMKALRLIFDPAEYELYLVTDEPGIQHVGIAVRRSSLLTSGFRVEKMSDGESGEIHRSAAALQVRERNGRPLQILAVHLKSGCHSAALDDPQPDRHAPAAPPPCKVLADEVPGLARWIAARTAEHQPFIVLGDFNRRFDADRGREAGGAPGVWSRLRAAANGSLVDVTSGRSQLGQCRSFDASIDSRERAMFIDTILMSADAAAHIVPGSVWQWSLDGRDNGPGLRRSSHISITSDRRAVRAYRRGLSDHCPLSVALDWSDHPDAIRSSKARR